MVTNAAMVKAARATTPNLIQTKMSLKIYDPELEKALRDYVGSIEGGTIIGVLNEILEIVFSTDTAMSSDIIENLKEMRSLVGLIDWNNVGLIREHLQKSPLTRNVSIKDVTVAICHEGSKVYMEQLSDH